jgi:glucose/arabinose dehydrogenase
MVQQRAASLRLIATGWNKTPAESLSAFESEAVAPRAGDAAVFALSMRGFMAKFWSLPPLVGFTLLLAACGEESSLPAAQGFGPQPTLPAPKFSVLPTINIAKAVGWAQGEQPTPASGFAVQAFASGLTHPRWLAVLPNGDVLVAETDAPPKPDDSKGIRGFVQKWVMKDAGSGHGSANRITLLRDTTGNGVADQKFEFLSGLNSPFGMTLVGDELYVANTDALLRFPYKTGETSIGAGVKVADLPAGSINHHWTKDVIASEDGKTLYVTVGSNSNVGENGLEAEEKNRADILAIDRGTGAMRVFASGLRNPNGLSWQPDSHALWVVVNERDEIGNDLVPDYMTSVKEGAFYGWPFSYYGGHVDSRVEPQSPELVAKAIAPDYALGSHTASLGLTFNTGDLFPPSFKGGAFIGQHGSWNRIPRSGYKVIFVPFAGGKPSGPPQDVLTGFLNEKGEARGRPVGVRIDRKDALLVADDVGGTVWRVAPAASLATQ